MPCHPYAQARTHTHMQTHAFTLHASHLLVQDVVSTGRVNAPSYHPHPPSHPSPASAPQHLHANGIHPVASAPPNLAGMLLPASTPPHQVLVTQGGVGRVRGAEQIALSLGVRLRMATMASINFHGSDHGQCGFQLNSLCMSIKQKGPSPTLHCPFLLSCPGPSRFPF
eukprot:scaffold104889_cov18-Tisochrysis_lutea.AAC.1